MAAGADRLTRCSGNMHISRVRKNSASRLGDRPDPFGGAASKPPVSFSFKELEIWRVREAVPLDWGIGGKCPRKRVFPQPVKAHGYPRAPGAAPGEGQT